MPPRLRAVEQNDALTPAQWLRQLGSEERLSTARGVCDDLFAEEPVPLDVFISDKHYIGMSPLSVPQATALRAAERVYYPELYPHMQAEFGDYWAPIPMANFLTLLVGKGGGKDLIARLMALRISYLLLCLKDPRDYFGMPSSESIHMLNVASTKDQARRAYFEPMTRIVRKGWFADKCDPKKNTIEWARGLESVSGSSDAETQEGLNLILGVADEIDAFRTADDIARTGSGGTRTPMRSAEGIIKMLRSSAVTRFPRTFKNVRISYPRYHGSPILQLHAESKQDIERKGADSKHFIVGPMPSWEFNPLLARTTFVELEKEISPVPVPEELVADFEAEPEWARAAYLCMPERTMLPPYFRSENSVDSAMVDTPEIEVHWEFAQGGWHPRFVIPQSLKPIPGATYATHCDLALNGDRAGFAMAHVVSWDKFARKDPEYNGQLVWDERPVVKVDTAIALEADLESDPPREIQLRFYRQLVFELQQRGFPIRAASMDGWQSVDNRQILQVGGIEAPLLSMDRTDEPYRQFRSLVEEGRVEIPYSRLLRNELLHLQQDPKKRKIDHPPGGSKDLSDAVCGAVITAVTTGGAEETTDPDEDPQDLFWVSSAAGDAPVGAEDVWRGMQTGNSFKLPGL
ncbi:MAG: hypothetical protein WC054_01035 [Candidatus Nanopelagicales bacterium]